MTKIFIDTGFVIALINQRDQYHREASEKSAVFRNSTLLVTDVVLLEIGNALVRNYKQEAIEIIEYLTTADDVEVIYLIPNLFNKALKLYKTRQDKQWGLVDCISFEVMWKTGITQVLTFDNHFAQAGFQIL